MFTRHISAKDWLAAKYKEIAAMSVEAGISVQDARDAEVMVDTMRCALMVESIKARIPQ